MADRPLAEFQSKVKPVKSHCVVIAEPCNEPKLPAGVPYGITDRFRPREVASEPHLNAAKYGWDIHRSKPSGPRFQASDSPLKRPTTPISGLAPMDFPQSGSTTLAYVNFPH